MRVAALILNWNNAELTKQAAASVAAQVDRVVLIDNHSEPNDRRELSRYASSHDMSLVLNEDNLGYAGGNNRGVAEVGQQAFDGILIMNNDAAAEPGAVQALVRRLEERPETGVVAPVIVEMARPDQVIHVACSLNRRTGATAWVGRGGLRSALGGEPVPTDYVSGEAFLSRLEVFDECGLMDERFGFYFEDTEWSLRVAANGWDMEVVPSAIFRHQVEGSMPSMRGEYLRARNRVLFLRWGLGFRRARALQVSLRPTAISAGALVKRRKTWLAVRGVLFGWLRGLLRPG